jgi:hypothetical protein
MTWRGGSGVGHCMLDGKRTRASMRAQNTGRQAGGQAGRRAGGRPALPHGQTQRASHAFSVDGHHHVPYAQQPCGLQLLGGFVLWPPQELLDAQRVVLHVAFLP